MRSKEEANDYRYFPEPDLVPLRNTAEYVDAIRKTMPELPQQVRKKYVEQYGLPEYDAEFISSDKSLSDFFQSVLQNYDNPKNVSNWIMGDLSKYLNDNKLELSEVTLNPIHMGKMLSMIDSGLISVKIGKTLLPEMIISGKDPERIVQEKGLVQISDSSALEKLVDEVLSENQENVASYKAGKKGLLGSFVGQVMKKSHGKANPKMVNEILLKKLG
jgi:aspartyl-tRNA(Asn)/glutamyl-tRNA(Gln) amidotransferase subunit B